MSFEEASRRAGSVPVNVLRLLIAFVFLTLANALTRGMPLPTDATPHQWTWLLMSGFVGFFIGDLTLFRAFVLLGARLCALITCTAPVFSLLAEAVLLKDYHFSGLELGAILTTIAGVALVVSERREANPRHQVTVWALLLAFMGAAGQGVGAVLTKRALEFDAYNAFATVQIRMIAGIAVFLLFVLVTRRVRDTVAALRSPMAMLFITLGAFGGPFLGVTLFVKSMETISPSTTQTIVSLLPIFMIPLAIWVRGETITTRALAGTTVAVLGVFLLIYAKG